MKHLKKFNEELYDINIREVPSLYRRTAGFRYSKPSIGYSVILYYIGKISDEEIKSALEDIDVSFENIIVDTETGKLDYDDETEEEISIDGKINFYMYVYNEREVDAIIEDLCKSLSTDDVEIVDSLTKFVNKKK